jgi:hypothetical protein
MIATDERIERAKRLITEIDRIIMTSNIKERRRELNELKHQVDNANLSTVCDKRELEIPILGARINVLQAAGVVVKDWWKDINRP